MALDIKDAVSNPDGERCVQSRLVEVHVKDQRVREILEVLWSLGTPQMEAGLLSVY